MPAGAGAENQLHAGAQSGRPRPRTSDPRLRRLPIKQMKSQGLRPSKKLAHQRMGPCKIVRRVGANAFELDLGNLVSSQTIPVFHVKYLSASPEGPYVSAQESTVACP